MYLLDSNLYEKTRHIFEKRLDFEMPVKTVINNKIGRVYVDDIKKPKSGYIELDYGFYYFGGKYNQNFICDVINHILTDIVPFQTLHNFAFIFADSDILKTEIIKKLNGIHNKYETRCYYVLNAEKFASERFDNLFLPDDYELKIDADNSKVTVLYNNVEMGYCGSGGTDMKTMECDVFLNEEHRNRKIGTLMCAKFIESNILQGYDWFTWGCWEANIPSCKLAEKLGFEKHYEDKAIIATVK